jgi:hypothetical protein
MESLMAQASRLARRRPWSAPLHFPGADLLIWAQVYKLGKIKTFLDNFPLPYYSFQNGI